MFINAFAGLCLVIVIAIALIVVWSLVAAAGWWSVIASALLVAVVCGVAVVGWWIGLGWRENVDILRQLVLLGLDKCVMGIMVVLIVTAMVVALGVAIRSFETILWGGGGYWC